MYQKSDGGPWNASKGGMYQSQHLTPWELLAGLTVMSYIHVLYTYLYTQSQSLNEWGRDWVLSKSD